MWDFFARAVRRVISVPPSARSSRSRSSVRQLHRPRASSSPLLPPATTVSPPRWNTQVQQTHAEVLHTPPLRAEESSAVGHPPSLSMPASFHDAKDQPAAESRNGCPPHPPPAEIPSSIGTGLSGLRRGLSSPQPPHTPTESGTFAAALGEVIPPSHLEVRMTAASLTIGAFVCAWRKASRGQWPLTSKTTHEATGTSSTTIRCPTVVVKDTVTPRTAGRERPTKGAEAPPTMVSLPEAIRDATLSREHPDVSVDQNSPESPVPHITLLAEHDVVTQACYREDMPVSSVSSSTDGDETDGELGDLSETSSPLRLAPRRESAGDPLWYSMSQSAPSTAQHQPPAPMGADRDGTPPSGRVGPRTQQVPAWPKELQQVRFSSTDIPELAAENERQDDSPAPHRKHGFAPSLDFFLSARAANAVVKLFLPQHPRNAAAGDVKVGPGIAPVDALPRDAQVVVERLLPLLVPCYSASFTPEAAVYISQRMWNRVVTQLKQGVSLGSSPSPPTGSSSLAATRNSSAMPLNSSNGPGAGEMEREGSSLWTRHSPRTAPLSSSPLTHPLAPPLASSGRQAATTDCGSPRVDSRMPGDPTTTSSIPSSSSCSCFELEFLTASLFTAAVGSLYPPVLETLFASTIYPALCHGAMSRSATFSRPIFPSLGLLVLNFGTAAAERCAPMVERVCRLCMQSPFSIELATVSSVLCSVYPQLRRVTQSLLARRMMEVLRHQPNPNSLRRLDKSPDRSCLADPQHTFSASTPLTTDGRSAMSSSPPRAPQGNAALFLGSTEADRAELTPAQRLEAKRLCFRVLQLYPYHWEGMTAFFLDVCTPYLHHSDEQLRRECVQSSVRALESDCFFPNSQGVIDRPERGRFLDDSLDYSSTHLQSPHTCNITRASEQTTSVGLGRGGVLIERDSSAAAAVVVQRGKHLLFVPPSIPSAPMPHKGTNISLPPPVCERHCGRTHVSTVREVVHQLVAVAVGDLEDRIRTIALRSLTPNTYQFLYAHEHLIGQLFVVLNDPVLENRVVAIRLLRNIAPSNPPLTYPPMRKVLQQLLDNFESRCAAFFYSQIGEREQHERQPAGITSSASSPVTFNGFPIFTAGSNIPIGCMTDPSLTVHAASLAVLTEIALCIPESTPIYLRRILLMLQFVLRNPRSDREAVVNALRLLTVLHEDSATEDWFLFRPFIRTTGHQLTIRDGDVVRMMSALAALQSILQSSEATTYAYVDLHDIVTCLHSLLYQKPSIGSDLSIAVLRLLGTISSIEPPHLDDMDRMPALIRRPDKPLEYPDLNAFLSDDANLQRYDVRDEPLGGHMIVPQLSRFHLFTSLLWPDVVIRVLLTAVFDYLSCTVTFTAEGLCECVDCIMRILSETTAVGRVAVYLPTMLTIVLNLISERHRAGHLQYTIVPGLLPLFLNSLAHLVSHVGRSIAPMYRLLHNFLIASWNLRQPTILNGCQLLQALCAAVPDLMKEHCQVWLMRLLTAITTYHRVEQSYVNMTLLHDPLNLDDTLTGHPLKKSGEDADLDLGGTTSAQVDLNPSGQAPGWNSILEAVYDRITTTIRMFQPLANVAARQMVCLNLSQALCEARSHGSNNMDLMKDERELLASTVNRLISKVLVEYIANCDVRTVATAIIENCMHHLHLLANIHMDALKQLRDESEWSKGHSSVASPGSTITSLPASPFRADQDTLPSRQVKTPRVQMAAVGDSATQRPTRKAFRSDDHRCEWEELLIEHRRRNFGGLCGGDEWWHCDSPLMRVGLRTAEGNAEVVRYFPLQSVRTSWESFAEMDILGCLLMILGRCRIQSVHYSVMVQAYVRLRFGDDEVLTVTSFFRCASSPLYRVELLGVMSQEAVDQLIRNPTVVIQRNKEDADATYANRCSLPDAMTARSEDVEHATGLDTAPFTPLEPSEWQNMSFEDLSLSHPGIPVVQVPSTTSLPIALSLRLAAAGVSPKLHSLASSQRSVPTGISAQEPPSRCSVPPEVSASGEQRVTEEETPLDFPPFLSREASFTDTRNSGAANRRLHPTLTSDPTNEINTSFYASRDDDTRREASSIPTAVGREELRFFEHHARLRPDKWRLWLERFCIMVAEAAPDPSVSICAHLIKQHRTSLMYSDLLPVALLSLWTSCTSTDDLREWMVAIRTFYRFHAHVPQLVAMEIARIGHFILLFAPSIFDEQINRTIIDVYITPTFVAELAHRASNPPLALFHVEQDLLRSFSAEKASFLVDVLDEVNALHDYSLVVDDPQLKLALIQFFSTTTAVDIHRDIPRPVRLELGDSRSDERNTLLKDFLLHSDLCAARRYLQYSFAGSGESSSSGGQASSSGAQASMSGSTAPSEEDSAADLSLMEVLFAMRFFSRVLDFESVLRLWSSTKRKLGTSPWEMVSGIGNGSRGMARSTAAPIARPISLSGSMDVSRSPPSTARRRPQRSQVVTIVGEEVLLTNSAATPEMLVGSAGTNGSDPLAACLATCPSNERLVDQELPHLPPEMGAGRITSIMPPPGATTVPNYNLPLYIARYAIVAAESLCRWDEVLRAAQFAREYESFALHPSLDGPGMAHPCSSSSDGTRTDRTKRFPERSPFRQGTEGASSPLAEEAGHHTGPDRQSPFQHQIDIFRAAAFASEGNYDRAKQTLTNVQNSLKDYYAVFHTEHTQLMLELNCMFQQVSNLEEGIHAIELSTMDDDSSSPQALPVAGDHSLTTRSLTAEELGREVNGRLFKISTIRRLRNVGCRPLPMGSTVLQRYEVIAVRSALIPAHWQISNILILTEQMDKEGLPFRSVRSLEHFARLPIHTRNFQAVKEYRETLELERLRRLVRLLSSTEEMECLYMDICIALRTDLALTRFGPKDGSPLTARAQMELEQQIRGAMCSDMAYVKVEDLGNSLTPYQAELVLLHMYSTRRLKLAHRYSNAANTLPTKAVNDQQRWYNLPRFSPIPAMNMCRRSADDLPLYGEEENEALLTEYYLLEHTISVSNYLPSIWREFGLLLFEVCLAMHHEWEATNDPATLRNFLEQSAKAMAALQQGAQMWRSASLGAVHGIGPFSTASQRRQRHSRGMLPSSSMMLKVLYLAVKCEESMAAVADVPVAASLGASSMSVHEKLAGSHWHSVTGYAESDKRGSTASNNQADHPDQGGFGALDFRAPMLVLWASIIPHLVWTATIYAPIRLAVRDLCVKWTSMLHQMIFTLIACFEHPYEMVGGRASPLAESTPADLGAASASCTHGSFSGWPKSTSTAADSRTVDHSGMSVYGSPKLRGLSQGSPNSPVGGLADRDSVFATSTTAEPSSSACRYLPTDIRSGTPAIQSSFLRDIAAASPEHRRIVEETLAFCHFIGDASSGSELSLSGSCRLPAPVWQLPTLVMDTDPNSGGENHPDESVAPPLTSPHNDPGSEEGMAFTQRMDGGYKSVSHVRRYIVPGESPHYSREDVYTLFLSDGWKIRMHYAIERPPVSSSEEPEAGLSCWNLPCTTDVSRHHGSPTSVGPSSPISSPTGRFPSSLPSGSPLLESAEMRSLQSAEVIMPYSLMEIAVCTLIGHLPLDSLRRPLVLPIGMDKFLTQLPSRVRRSTTWPTQLPESTHHTSLIQAHRKPTSLYYTHDEYCDCLHREDTLKVKQELFSSLSGTAGFSASVTSLETPIMTSVPRLPFELPDIAEAELRCSHVRQQNKLAYHNAMTTAMDTGDVGPLKTLVENTLEQRPSSEGTSSIKTYEYFLSLPRPVSHLKMLLQRIQQVELTVSMAPSSVAASEQDDEENASEAEALTEQQREAQRLCVLDIESCRHGNALRHAFAADGMDPSHWLNARRRYTQEMAEWSVVTFLLDMYHRETGNFFIDTSSGHVATHRLGRYTLQSTPERRRATSCKRSSDRIRDAEGSAGLLLTQEDALRHPFPNTDPTVFRLTRSLRNALSVESPHARFQSHTALSLYEIYNYSRDISDYSTFGLDVMTGFAWRPTTPRARVHLRPMLPRPPVHAKSHQFPLSGALSTPLDDLIQLDPSISTAVGEESMDVALPVVFPSNESACHVTGVGNGKSISTGTDGDDLNGSASTRLPSSYAALPFALDSSMRLPRSRRVVGSPLSPPTASCSQIHNNCPVGASGILPNIRRQLPCCFDGQSMRIKLRCDEPLFRLPDVEFANRAIILDGMRKRRAQVERGHGAVSMDDADSPLPPLSRDETEHFRHVAASMASHSADATSEAAPTQYNTAYGFASRLIAVSTDAKNLLGSEAAPHSASRWAPHW